MSDDQAREMRPETTSEHIARDMREGRFPEQSERQMVPVLASLPHEIQVWRSMDAFDHTGTWSTTRYPAEAVTYVSKADAAAAMALVVERAVDALEGQPRRVESLGGQSTSYIQLGEAVTAIRALAPADGLAAVEALRVEARENAMQALASMGQAQEAYEAQLEAEAELDTTQTQLGDWIVRADEANVRVEKLEAELARVKADAAVAVVLVVEQAAKVPRLHAKQLQQNGLTAMSSDFDHIEAAIRALAPADGLAMVQELRAERATLAKTPTDPGDGWTWNERLGWIGPDGNPAGPRRRG